MFYRNIANALTLLPELNTFELSGMHWGSSPKTVDKEGRIWQSQPLVDISTPDHGPFHSGFFLGS
jgi:hypothetical protein